MKKFFLNKENYLNKCIDAINKYGKTRTGNFKSDNLKIIYNELLKLKNTSLSLHKCMDKIIKLTDASNNKAIDTIYNLSECNLQCDMCLKFNMNSFVIFNDKSYTNSMICSDCIMNAAIIYLKDSNKLSGKCEKCDAIQNILVESDVRESKE